MRVSTRKLTRQQIGEFIKSDRGIRAFEEVQSDTTDQGNALTDASFLVLTSEPTLGSERGLILTAGDFVSVDSGANGNFTVSLATTAVTAGTYGSASRVSKVTVDAKGRVTGVVEVTITPAAIGAVPTTRTVSTGAGLSGGGDLSANRTLAVQAAGTYGAPSGTVARAAFASYTAAAISALPTQAEVQAIANALQVVSQTLAALITDMRANGNLA